jgi:hypothetical protein
VEIPILVAVISAASAITAAIVAAQRAVKRVEQRFEGAKRSLATCYRGQRLCRSLLVRDRPACS